MTEQSTQRDALLRSFEERIIENPDLDRSLVSFQGNKQIPFYSWFKYKEGFSRELVRYLLQNLTMKPGVLLDPFAGTGSALFAAAELGWKTLGIEVLPVGLYAIQARLATLRVDKANFGREVSTVIAIDFADYYDERYGFDHIAITKGAYPEREERELIGYIAYCNTQVQQEDVRTLMLYAAFCILESMSFTRKDGQYLRWDARSGRSQGKTSFNKGTIFPFRSAIQEKLNQIANDLTEPVEQLPLFEKLPQIKQDIGRAIDIRGGSCLDLLPAIPKSSIDFVLTSPPYANRYDYTRTYALELIYLGCGDADVKALRQMMLSCTVENKEKRVQLEKLYTDRGRQEDFIKVDGTFKRQQALQEVLSLLNNYKKAGRLNNPHIARLVHNYFYEMSFVIYELARVLRQNGIVAMVNDNVRYAGEEIPVDLILSDIAESFDFTTRYIWTLGRGKGNSSQQMGSHGRSEMRKCVYVWQKN